MASQTQGIQQLLAAEKRAAEKINEARKRKLQRTKQAKQEAQAEVEKYKQVINIDFNLNFKKLIIQQREAEFKAFEQQYLGTKEDIESKIRRDTEDQISGMKQSVAGNKQAVSLNKFPHNFGKSFALCKIFTGELSKKISRI